MNPSHEQYFDKMIARYRNLTGVIPDEASDITIRFHILADQLAGLEAQLNAAQKQMSPDTAEGEALDRHAEMRGLLRKGAAPALGALQFTRSAGTQAAVTIPAGTLCSDTSGVFYVTENGAQITAGEETVTVAARAKLPGIEGNSAPGRITMLARQIDGIASVTNPAAFTGGCGPEPDDALRKRILAFDRDPSYGANAGFYRTAAESFPGVASAAILAGQAPHEVNVFIAQDGQQSVEESVCHALAAHLNELREPCTNVIVKSAPALAIDVAISIEPVDESDFSDVKMVIERAVRAHMEQCAVGQRFTRADLSKILIESGCIANFQIEAPSVDMIPRPEQLIRPGKITVTRLGAAG